jgi:hypothetical protein
MTDDVTFQQPAGWREVAAINGHQYELRFLTHGRIRPQCTSPCWWTGTPWRPETGTPERIDHAAREWHTHAATAPPITREQAAS